MVIRIPADDPFGRTPTAEESGVMSLPVDNVDPVKAEFENRRAVMRQVCARTRHLGEAVAELQALDDQFTDDSDFGSILPRYREQVDSIRQRRIEEIGDEGVGKVFDKEFGFIAEGRRIAFDGNTHKREVAHERQTLNDSLDRFAFAATNANSPLERQMMLDAAGTSIREAATVGYITPQYAELLTAGFQDNIARREQPPAEEVIVAEVDTAPDTATDAIPTLPMEGLIGRGRVTESEKVEADEADVQEASLLPVIIGGAAAAAKVGQLLWKAHKTRKKLKRLDAGKRQKQIAAKPKRGERKLDGSVDAGELAEIGDQLASLVERKFEETNSKKVIIDLPEIEDAASEGVIEAFTRDLLEGRYPLGNDRKVEINLGRVPGNVAERVRQDTGTDVRGYSRTLDVDGLRHAFNRHGPGQEKRQDQEPISPEAVSLYLEVVGEPDLVEPGITEEGLPGVVSTKRVNGHMVVVEEVHKSKRHGGPKLVFKTMWIKKAR